MRHPNRFRGKLLLVAVFGFLFPVALEGQEAGAGGETVASQEPKPLTLDDYGRWTAIGQTSLSANGRWVTFSYAPNEGDSKLFLRDLNDLAKDPLELSVNGTSPVFSDDSRWLAYIAAPGGGGRGAGGESGGAESEGGRGTRIRIR